MRQLNSWFRFQTSADFWVAKLLFNFCTLKFGSDESAQQTTAPLVSRRGLSNTNQRLSLTEQIEGERGGRVLGLSRDATLYVQKAVLSIVNVEPPTPLVHS